jgi:hypothetical protein
MSEKLRTILDLLSCPDDGKPSGLTGSGLREKQSLTFTTGGTTRCAASVYCGKTLTGIRAIAGPRL